MRIARKQLRSWLEYWRADLLLRENEPIAAENYSATIPDVPESEEHREGDHEIGEIVLMPPDTLGTAALPRYVVVVAVRESDWREVIPFSRFPAPATTGELITTREELALRVLCLWNKHRVETSRLSKGWTVGKIDEKDLKLIEDWGDILVDGYVPQELQTRTGAPLEHPADPRFQYLDEERTAWMTDYECLDWDTEWEDPIAAEEKEKYRP